MISLGYLIGTIIAAIIFTGVLAGSALIGRALRRDNEYVMARAMNGLGIGLAVATAGIWTWGAFPPFDMDYHTYRPVTGIVESVDKRLLADGDGMSEKYVVALAGDPQQYGCEDTRCALIRVGEPVELSCQKMWVYAGTDGYDCRFVQAGGRS